MLDERHAVDVLHRHQLLTVDLDQVVEAADIGRRHLPGGPDLVAQQLQSVFRLEQLRMQALQCHFEAELQVVGPPYLPHPASTEKRLDAIPVAEKLAWVESLPVSGRGLGIHSSRTVAGRFRRRTERWRLGSPIIRGQLEQTAGTQTSEQRTRIEESPAVAAMRDSGHSIRLSNQRVLTKVIVSSTMEEKKRSHHVNPQYQELPR